VPTDKVFIVGDSLTAHAASFFDTTIFELRAQEGRSLFESVPLIRRVHAAATPRRPVIIALGSNDVAQDYTTAQMRYVITAAANALPGRAIYWTTVKVGGVSPIYNPRWSGAAYRWNQQMWKHPKVLHVLNWTKEAREHPSYFVADGLHMNAHGQENYAEFISSAGVPAPVPVPA
jgi:lysophospholipase L1-like esterase